MAHTAAKSNSPPERLAVSVPGAMHVSGLGRTRLYEAMAAGELASCKVGRRRLILLEDLHAWLARQRHPAIRDMPTAPAIRPPASAGKATRARTEIGR